MKPSLETSKLVFLEIQDVLFADAASIGVFANHWLLACGITRAGQQLLSKSHPGQGHRWRGQTQ